MDSTQKKIAILRALLNGQFFELDNEVFCFSDDNRLCVEKDRYTDGEWTGKVYLDTDISLAGFLNMFCEKISDEEVLVTAANKALTEFNRKDRGE